MLFDRVLIVDWSANNSPTTGADSVWIANTDRSGIELTNPPTRRHALEQIAAAALPDQRTLLGVDFSLGFPRGTAAALGLAGTPWRAMWDLLGSEVRDDDRNRNNRFSVASDLNRRFGAAISPGAGESGDADADAAGGGGGSGSAGPFWGCPPSRRTDHLASTKPQPQPQPGWPPEWRHVEHRLRHEGLRPFSAWQLLGAGAVGSQSLVGIAALERLRWNLGDRLRVWPFETGFVALSAGHSADVLGDITVAEVWPSRWPVDVPAGMVKDAAQVSATAQRFLDMDEAGTLAALFTPTVDPGDVDDVLDEEGWALGVT